MIENHTIQYRFKNFGFSLFIPLNMAFRLLFHDYSFTTLPRYYKFNFTYYQQSQAKSQSGHSNEEDSLGNFIHLLDSILKFFLNGFDLL